MFSSEEKSIQEAVFSVFRGSSQLTCKVFIREAISELTTAELSSLSDQQRMIWSTLTSSKRRLEWSEARRCEFRLRQELGESVKTSISHSQRGKTLTVFSLGVTGNALSGPVKQVGIDAELKSRPLSEAVGQRIIALDEDRFGLDLIQIWVIKEALFKANPKNQGTVLSQYCLTSMHSDQHSGTAYVGNEQLHYAWIELTDWFVAVSLA